VEACLEESILKVLKELKIFKDFTITELEYLESKMEYRELTPDTRIFTEGDMGSEFFVILKGSVVVYKKDAGSKEHELSRLVSGDSFGEMALIDKLPRSASVSTIDRTQLGILTQEAFQEIKKENLEIYAHILLNLAREFSSRLRSMDTKYIKVIDFFF